MAPYPTVVFLEKDEVDSTQDEVKLLLASPSHDYIWVLARHQRKGRGRMGRSWTTPSQVRSQLQSHSHSVVPAWLASVGFRLGNIPARAKPLVSLVAGEILHRQIKELLASSGALIFLKWPNDLVCLLPGEKTPRKLAGILAESSGSDGIVLGVGLNLAVRPDLQEPVAAKESAALGPACLRDLWKSARPLPTPQELAEVFQGHLNQALLEWREMGDAYVEKLLRSLETGAMAPLWGRQGRLGSTGEAAMARGLGPWGALRVLRQGATEEELVSSGEFRLGPEAW